MGSSFVSRATEVWVSAACPSANASPRRVREHGDCRDMRNSRESREQAYKEAVIYHLVRPAKSNSGTRALAGRALPLSSVKRITASAAFGRPHSALLTNVRIPLPRFPIAPPLAPLLSRCPFLIQIYLLCDPRLIPTLQYYL
ncbi:hypothetical protein C8J57DRAFT_1719458 [Mycena rebaudengoi]|nr:hypothetical protein C8J57DRAFT_1719458 [Mycena rebaudengoi]